MGGRRRAGRKGQGRRRRRRRGLLHQCCLLCLHDLTPVKALARVECVCMSLSRSGKEWDGGRTRQLLLSFFLYFYASDT